MKKSSLRIVCLLTAVIGTALFLGGCATPAPLNYSPSSTLTASGNVTVNGFKYLPADAGKVKPNQIRNTAIGDIIVDQNVDVYFKDAVFKELRFVGVKLDSKDRILTGEIQEFLIDDLGYSVDWTIITRYIVKDNTDKVIYDSVKTTKRHTSKFINVFGALNETIKVNIEEIIKDPAFLAAIKE